MGALLACIALCLPRMALADVVVAGQTIGKSTWDDGRRIDTKRFEVRPESSTAYTDGPVLTVQGRILARTQGRAELFYDARGTLAAARLHTNAPEKALRALARRSAAREQDPESFVLGDLRLRVESEGEQRFVQVSTPAFDAALKKAAAPGGGLLDRIEKLAANGWLLAAAAGLVLAPVVWLLMSARAWIWERRCDVLDHAIALCVTVAAYRAFPQAWLAPWWAQPVQWAGYWIIATWSLRTVRVCGWLPREPGIEYVWALPATPVLLVPAVLRNAAKSPHVAGILVLFAALVGGALYQAEGDVGTSLVWLGVIGFVGNGVVHVYRQSVDSSAQQEWSARRRAVMGVITWPVTALCLLMVGAWEGIKLFFGVLVAMLLPAVACLAAGVVFDLQWLTWIGLCLPFAGLVPAAGVLVAFLVLPLGRLEPETRVPAPIAAPDIRTPQRAIAATALPSRDRVTAGGGWDSSPAVALPLAAGAVTAGIASVGFDPSGINPATGLAMVGAVDTAGNPYGVGSPGGLPAVNPATALPMVGAVDVAGNPYGCDSSSDSDWSCGDDSYSGGGYGSYSGSHASFHGGYDFGGGHDSFGGFGCHGSDSF